MTRIIWDAIGERKYETGIRNAVLYPQSDEGLYPRGVAWNGISALNENPSGAEAQPIWADDIKYVEMRSAEEFGGTIEAYTYPDEWKQCDGSREMTTGMTIGQQVRRPFGLVYRTTIGNDVLKNDYGYKLQIVYNATASPSGKQYSTMNDNPDAMTMSWEFSTIPVAITGYKPSSTIEIESIKFTTDDQKAKLKKLEDILFGTDGEDGQDARLPLPDEIYAILTA